jgi:diketogulonate reductase-like aldo/keto reductase
MTSPSSSSTVIFGTWRVHPDEVRRRLQTIPNITHVDTATLYRNHTAVRPGDGTWITTKSMVDNLDVDRSLRELERSAVHQFLLHTPRTKNPHQRTIAWDTIASDPRIELCGVSNFSPEHIRRLLESATTSKTIAANQIEMHPGCLPQETIDFCLDNHIAVQAYSPLGSGALVNDPQIVALADKQPQNTTPAQLLLAWSWSHGATDCVVRTGSVEHWQEMLLAREKDWDAFTLEQLTNIVQPFRVCADYSTCL